MEHAHIKSPKRVWESVQLYAVNCGMCSKWRIIPTKEKYEEIRETIDKQYFTCENAREWQPNLSCEDDADLEQNNNMRWAMDRPSIPQSPHGWQRILRIRAEGGTKFADVYYVTPTNKRLRSMVEINRYLNEHPSHLQEGINMSQFSFQSPIPLDGNCVAKRRSHDMNIVPSKDNQSNHLQWMVPYEDMNANYGVPEVRNHDAR